MITKNGSVWLTTSSGTQRIARTNKVVQMVMYIPEISMERAISLDFSYGSGRFSIVINITSIDWNRKRKCQFEVRLRNTAY